MNIDDKITSIHDIYLQDVIRTNSIASMDLLHNTEFKSVIWDIYISGVSYGIWTSICDPEFIKLDDISNLINEHVLMLMN